MKVLVWVLLVLASVIIEAELIAWCRPLQRWLIRRAAAPLPRHHRDRYTREWCAELETIPDGPVTRLSWVLSLVLRRASLARALGVSRSTVGFTGALKRLADIVLTSVALLIVSPLMLTIAALITLQDGGPVIFRQVRIGRDGKPFTMLKFRSMSFNEGNRSLFWFLWSDHDHPQITILGRFLRDFSLDELPQLFNVLAGSMSLVGPRPRLRNEAAHLPMEGVTVRPGLTGPWQTSGLSSLDTDDATRLDREYVKHWSLWLDIKIVIKTFIAVLGEPARARRPRKPGNSS